MSTSFPELPGEGLLCVEASAGTGKTHRLSTLAVRWLVERDDLSVAELLVVTYTIAAAAELRGRIRERLAEVRDRLGARARPTTDDYLEWLAASPDAPRVRDRAVRALAEFDTATIRTIHAFAAGALGDDDGAVAPTDARRRQAVTDVLAAASYDDTSALWDLPSVGASSISEVVALRLDHPDLVLAPLDGADAPAAATALRDTAQRAIDTFTERQRRDGALTYSDLLTRLEAAIRDEDSRLLRALRGRFRVGLIDEFQDTDAIQWRIFTRVFLDAPGRTLVVVGDPKQAIYGFRGADIDAYLDAMDLARATGSGPGLGVESLGTNYRSDGAMLRALNGLYDGATFDEAGRIAYSHVIPSEACAERRILGADGAELAPVSIRIPTQRAKTDEIKRAIAEECADEALRVLSATVLDADGNASTLSESDVAVLCARRLEFAVLKEAFLRRGIRTTESRSDDVMSSPALLHVEVALRALGDPSNASAVAAFAHSIFGPASQGGSTTALARERLGAWRAALEDRGVTALARAMTAPGATEGLVQGPDGERTLTDVLHLFDLLGAVSLPGAGPTALLEALRELGGAPEASDENTRARRIDTDAPAVRLMTIHGAKGLEFGVVLCPFIQRTSTDTRGPTIWRDASSPGRLIDAGRTAPWRDTRLGAPLPEDRAVLASAAAGGESRRLHYVALTRAKHRCVVWWLAAYDGPSRRRDELAGLFFDRDSGHRPVQRPRSERSEPDASCYDLRGTEALAAIRDHLAPLVGEGVLEVVGVPDPPASSHGTRRVGPGRGLAAGAELTVSTLDRSLALRERRCSFSSLVSGAHRAPTTLDTSVGDAGSDDEGPDTAVEDASLDPFGGMRGTAFGTAVHEALEAALSRRDGTTFDEAATEALSSSMHSRSIDGVQRATQGLLAAASVGVAGGPPLRELARGSVATELRFTLPVAEGVDLRGIGAVLAEHDPSGPFQSWSSRLGSEPSTRSLAASLVGSIDLVSTLGTASRFSVLDYKTNVCEPNAGGYGPEGLLAAMCVADYPLQAALYLVALHRYLRWRLADYDPANHLGGAHFLFLRGMRPGSDEGVFSWLPPHQAVCELSDLLAGTT